MTPLREQMEKWAEQSSGNVFKERKQRKNSHQMCLWKIRRVPSPTWVIDDRELKLSNSSLLIPVSPPLFFLLPNPVKMAASVSPNSSQLLSQLASTFRLGSNSSLSFPSPLTSQVAEVWLSHAVFRESLLSLGTPENLLSLRCCSFPCMNEARCLHKAPCPSKYQPRPLATAELTFLRVWVISITSEFPPVLGFKEKPAPTGPFSSLGIGKKDSLHGRDDCLFLFNCDWWPRNHSHQMQRLC